MIFFKLIFYQETYTGHYFSIRCGEVSRILRILPNQKKNFKMSQEFNEREERGTELSY